MASKKQLAGASVTKPAKAKAKQAKAKRRQRQVKKRGREILHQQEDLARRLWDDDDLQDDLRSLAEGLKRVYDRVQDEGPASLLEDKKVHKQVRGATEHARSAAEALTSTPRKRGRRGGLLLLLVGGLAAVVLVPALREKALDLVFGPEEEFDYAASTTPAPPAPAPAAEPTAGGVGDA